MPEDIDLGYAVRLPPRRAVAYFKQKGYTFSWDWWEVWQAQHAKAFTVAKAMREDVLADIRNGIADALAEGLTERQFIQRLEPLLAKKGWWGKAPDPQRPDVEVQLGSHRRLKTIYRTNMRTARAVARHQTMKEGAVERPYWMYDAMDDARTRASHAAMDNLVFPHDDPIWDTHFPPNGWNCRCRVVPLSREEMESRGLAPQDSGGRLQQVRQQTGIDRRTGEVIYREGTRYDGPRGPMTPDAGWSYNPGAAGGPPDPNLPPISQALPPAPGQKTWRDYGLPAVIAAVIARSAARPSRVDVPDTQEARMAQFRQELTEGGFKPIRFPNGDVAFHGLDTPDGYIYLTERFVYHVIVQRPHEKRDEFVRYVIPTLKDPAEIWLEEVEVRGKKTLQKFYLAAYADKGAMVLVRENPKDAWVSWTFVPTRDGNHFRKGALIYARPREEER